MRFIGLTIAGALAMLASGPAWADWSYTRWGMTPDEVVAASGGKATQLTPEAALQATQFVGTTCLVEVVRPEPIAGINFSHLRFCFDGAGKLNEIDLTTDPSAYDRVNEKYAGVLGEPSVVRDDRRTYRDPARGNIVEVSVSRYGTYVRYLPADQGL